MATDYTDHNRWGFVLDRHHFLRMQFEIRDKRDLLKLRGIIPEFQNKPVAEFVAMIGDAQMWSTEFPTVIAQRIATTAQAGNLVCRTEPFERLDYLIYDIAAGDLLQLNDEAEYQRIVELLKTNGNPIVDEFDYGT